MFTKILSVPSTLFLPHLTYTCIYVHKIHLINFCVKIDSDNIILLFKFIYFNTKIGFRTAENISMALRNFL